MSDLPQCSKLCTMDKFHAGPCNESGSEQYNWLNLTAAQQLVVQKTGFGYAWLVQFEYPQILHGMVQMAERILELEGKHG